MYTEKWCTTYYLLYLVDGNSLGVGLVLFFGGGKVCTKYMLDRRCFVLISTVTRKGIAG